LYFIAQSVKLVGSFAQHGSGVDSMKRRLFFLFWVLAFLSPGALSAGDWPQFRGPAGDGHSGATGIPRTWSDDENVIWKTPVDGRAWSSPVVLDDQIWLTTALETPASADETRERVKGMGIFVPSPHLARKVTLKALCLERTTGRRLHDVTLFEVDRPPVICAVNSYASPTPVAERGRAFFDFGTMGTACLDTKSGKQLWSRCFAIEHQVGPGSSPVLYRDLLILVRDGCDQQYLIALDKTTGRTVWRTDRPPITRDQVYYRKAFSTPLIVTTAQRDQMIVPGAQWIVSYNPSDGKEMWRVDTGSTYSNVSRPVYGHGMVYVCTAYGGTRLLAIRVDGRGDVTATHVAWELKKQTPKKSSPLLLGDELYFVSDGGVANCVDAKTGQVHWSERLADDYSASPVFADGCIFFFSEDGTTTVVRPGAEYVELAENALDGRVMASPAIVDRSIFLRSDSHLYRIALQR